MATPRSKKLPDPEKMTFEQATEELEAIIQRIEDGEIGLQESLEQRRRGDELIKRCRAVLDAAELELEQMSLDDKGDDSGSDAERD